MIENEDQLKQTRVAIGHLESALAALKRDILPLNPKRFALMAEPIVDDIKTLRQEVDEYIGVAAAIEHEATVWMRLEGPEMELGDAPTSIVTQMIDIFRVGVQTVAELVFRGVVGTRPTGDLKNACDFRIVGWQPGSVRVGLRLPDDSPALFEDATPSAQARRALDLYLKVAAWVGSDESGELLEKTIPDPDQRRLVLNQVARLVPRPRGGLESVELSGTSAGQTNARLHRESRERIHNAISLALREQHVEARGILRQIDLDARTFTIRDFEGPLETRCVIADEDDALLEIAKDSLDHLVIVSGTRPVDPTRHRSFALQIKEIEVLEKREAVAVDG